MIEITRKWAMPNRKTFLIGPITKLLQKNITFGYWADPFANDNTIKKLIPDVNFLTNDLNPEFKTDFHLDALDFLKNIENDSLDGTIYDPPYSPRAVSEVYKGFGKEVTMKTTQATFWSHHKDEMARIIKKGGVAICFGWNSMGLGINRNFKMKEILLVPHGGAHNDTIVTIEEKG